MALVDTRMILNAGLRIFERELQFVSGTSNQEETSCREFVSFPVLRFADSLYLHVRKVIE